MSASRRVLALSLVLGSTAALAYDVVTVTFNDVSYGEWVTISYDGGERVIAGELYFTVDGADVYGYCVDLDHPLSYGNTYQAELVPLPLEPAWCTVANLLDANAAADDHSGAVIQAAIWKALYADVGLTVDPLDAEADALLAAVGDGCYAGCEVPVDLALTTSLGEDDLVWAEIAVTREGEGIGGQAVAVATSMGTLVDPADGIATTDATGMALVAIDPGGNPDGLVVSAAVAGRDYLSMVPTVAKQQTVAVFPDECTWEGSTAVVGDGCPAEEDEGDGYHDGGCEHEGGWSWRWGGHDDGGCDCGCDHDGWGSYGGGCSHDDDGDDEEAHVPWWCDTGDGDDWSDDHDGWRHHDGWGDRDGHHHHYDGDGCGSHHDGYSRSGSGSGR